MLDLIKKYEGCELEAYKCPAGIWTIGFGSTFYEDGTKIKEGDTITQERAESLLQWYCTKKIKLPNTSLNNGQIEAIYSLIYNIGQGAFDKSSLKKAIENRDLYNIFNNWNWIKAGGQTYRGLCKRRSHELYLFMSDKF